jgi:6-phosphogluconolactonase
VGSQRTQQQRDNVHLDRNDGSLRPVQILPTLPSRYTGNNTGAEIAFDPVGSTVYTSNRGHDSVAIFKVDAKTGVLKERGWQLTQGQMPRFISLDPGGRFLYAANKQSDSIVAFRVDRGRGRLIPTGEVIRNASPVTITFGA